MSLMELFVDFFWGIVTGGFFIVGFGLGERFERKKWKDK